MAINDSVKRGWYPNKKFSMSLKKILDNGNKNIYI